MPGSGAFEASTPADAQMKPWLVSAITSEPRVRTTRFASRRTTSIRRGSPSPASSRARADGSTSSRRTMRPSIFEIAFCATTSTSPSSQLGPLDDHAREVVSFAELGQPADGRDRQLGHSPTIWTPAWPR